jgi:tetratricopeptide (TPR) repeat protein
MLRGIGRRWLRPASLLVLWLTAIAARAADSPAVERFRAAAALQNRSLYDLAIAEYDAIIAAQETGPLADRARVQRGVCSFHLGRFDEACAQLSDVQARRGSLSPAEQEQLLAFYALAEFNLSQATADAAAQHQHLDAAIELLSEQLTSFPNGGLAERSSYYRAEALYARGRLDAAVSAYRDLLTRFPNHPQRAEALYAQGIAEQEHGDHAAAVETFDRFCTGFPQHPCTADANERRGHVLLALAEQQFQAGQTAVCHRVVERLLAQYPESAFVPKALLLRAGIETKSAHFEIATATLDRCIARSTDPQVTHEARLLRATVRQQRGDVAGAFADADKVVAAEPQRSAALHTRGLCELGLDRPADAVRTLRTLTDRDPSYLPDRVLYDLAWAYRQAEDTANANVIYNQLIVTQPNSPLVAECHFRLGESEYTAGNYSAAATRFDSAFEATADAPLRERSLHKLAWSQFEQRQFAAAQATFDRQANLYNDGPLAADGLIMAAECLFQQQSFVHALPHFTAAIARPEATDTLRAMALVHAAHAAGELGEWTQSRDLAAAALDRYPACDWATEARCELGAAQLELGQLDAAERELSVAFAQAKPPLSLRAEFSLARVQLARGMNDEAVRAFFKVAYGHGGTKAPQSYHHWQAESIYAAAQTLEAAGRADSAKELYRELVNNYPASSRTATAQQSLDRIMRR